MKFAYRMVLYLLGGGVLLAWARPAPGVMESAACVALVMLAALLDSRLAGRTGGKAGTGTVSMAQFRSRKAKGGAPGAAQRERRVLQTVYQARQRQDAEALMALLRERGLNPLMVSSTAAGQRNAALFEVRLSSAEALQARSLIREFQSRGTPGNG